MKIITTEVKVGFFVVLAAVVLGYIVFKIDKKIPFFNKETGYPLIIYFDSISGVEKKSLVRMAGVEIGKVLEIVLENNQARVVVLINQGITIYKNSVVRVRSRGVLGEKYVEISGGTKDQPALKDGDMILTTIQPADIDEMISKLAVVLNDIQAVTNSIRNIFGTKEGEEGLKKIFDNIQSITANIDKVVIMTDDKLRNILDEISGLINKFASVSSDLNVVIKNNEVSFGKTIDNFQGLSGQLKEDAPKILVTLEKVTNKINEILTENQGTLKDSLNNVRDASGQLESILSATKDLIKSFKDASESIQTAATTVNDLTKKVGEGQGTVGKLLTDPGVYDKLDSTLASVNKMTSKADTLKIYTGFRGEQQIDEGDSKGFFSLKLQPREDRYYLFEATEDLRKKKITHERNSLADIKYTFLFGKRYDDLGLKIGLMESSFGLGMDYNFLNDRLNINLDVFNIRGYDSYTGNPQIKLTAKYYLYKYIFLQGGIDEAINSHYRTTFAGIGINFADEDLKYLLGTIRLR